MRSVVWSETALAEFESALQRIAADSPSAATLVADRIDNAAARLGEMATGRPGRVLDTYEKPVSRTSYVMAYAVTDTAITILRVIHGNRHWPEGEWPAD